MFDHLTQFLLAASPWLFGWLTAGSLTKSVSFNSGSRQIILSISGFASAVLIVSLHAEFTRQITPSGVLAGIVFLLALLAAWHILKKKTFNVSIGRSVFSNPDLITISLVFFIGSIIFISLIHHLYTPLQSWDALQYWAPRALAEMEVADAEGGKVHPRLIALFLAWNNLTQDGSPQLFQFISWFMLWISYALLVHGFSLNVGCSRNVALLLTLISLSVPLIENHANRPGYAELALGYVLSAAVVLTAIGFAAKRAAVLCAGLAMSSLLLVLKNTGLFYLTCLWTAALWALLYYYSKQLLLVMFILLLPLGYILYSDGFVFVAAGQVLEWTPWLDYGKVAGRKLELANTPISALFENQLHAWVINQSFSVLFVGVATVTLMWMTFGHFRGPATDFILLCILLGLGGIVLAQLTEYGLRYAIPTHDTSGTRLAIPIFMLVPLMFALLVAFVESRGRGYIDEG